MIKMKVKFKLYKELDQKRTYHEHIKREYIRMQSFLWLDGFYIMSGGFFGAALLIGFVEGFIIDRCLGVMFQGLIYTAQSAVMPPHSDNKIGP